MGQPYIGEIRMFGGNFAPAGWMFCEGQLLSIAENEALFTLIGTTYGGDGDTTFRLPDLRGRIPVHQGAASDGTYVLNQGEGTEEVTLSASQIPAHSHNLMGSTSTATSADPANALPAQASRRIYSDPTGMEEMASSAIQSTGGNQPHSNMQPYLCISFIISLFGVWPSQT
jgi:microcystin-dependent protein